MLLQNWLPNKCLKGETLVLLSFASQQGPLEPQVLPLPLERCSLLYYISFAEQQQQAHFKYSRGHFSFVTFIQHGSKNCQIVIDRGAVPASASELVLALLNADLHPLCNTGHDFHVVPTETELFGHQTWDAATEDRLSAQ